MSGPARCAHCGRTDDPDGFVTERSTGRVLAIHCARAMGYRIPETEAHTFRAAPDGTLTLERSERVPAKGPLPS